MQLKCVSVTASCQSLLAALSVEGEMLTLSKVTRSEMGAYMCIASNGVPPTVSKRMKLQVHCEYEPNLA